MTLFPVAYLGRFIRSNPAQSPETYSYIRITAQQMNNTGQIPIPRCNVDGKYSSQTLPLFRLVFP